MKQADIIKELKANQIWLEQVMMITPFKKTEIIFEMLDKFNIHLGTLLIDYTTQRDFATHFMSWLRKQPLQTIKIAKPKDDEWAKNYKLWIEKQKR